MTTSPRMYLGLIALTVLSLTLAVAPAVALYYYWRQPQSQPTVVASSTLGRQRQPQVGKSRPAVLTPTHPVDLATSQPVVASPVVTAQTQPITVQVRILSATVGTIKLRRLTPTTQPGNIFDVARDQGLVSDDVLLRVELEITNASNSPVKYQPWSGGGVLLRDDQGRVHAAGVFADAIPEGSCLEAAALRPGNTIKDVLVFQRPKEGATQLKLVLPGKNLGQEQPVMITIPATKNGVTTNR